MIESVAARPARALGLALAVLLAGCGSTVVNPVSGRAERTVMNLSQELEQGRRAHQSVLKEYGTLQNPALQAYVNTLGQKLAAQSHRAELEWHFTVLDSPEVNAFALPGGYVYVTRGLMAYMESEADLAGVIGHEIGHVTARHGAQRATRQQNAGLGVLAATVLGAVLESRGVGGATDLAGQVSQGVAAGYVAAYSREQELQADQLGAEYLSRSHYDPRHMIDVIQVLKDQERFAADQARAQGRPAPSGGGWLASHPSNEERLQRIRDEAATLAGNSGTKPLDEGRSAFLKAIEGMPYGDSPAQGLVRGRQFLHPELDIALTAPEGWQIQNGTETLTLMAPGRDAALQLQALPPRATGSHEAILRQWGAEQGRTESRRINGLAATQFSGWRRNAQGQRSMAELTLITSSKGQVYALSPLARDAQALQQQRMALRQSVESFRSLSAEDRQLARPWRIALKPFPAGGFAELAKGSVLSEARLRLLNGRYGDARTPPATGRLVKVVVAGPAP
ncbi:MAG: M48 family metalloprotease [Roseateles asaccharophilus]|uniref:Putative Zn-dependent protease n=1 Tax=Roseateles asaccharophilus TaxID=582607 RepID=A0A4R6NCR9_9BURK|nr:M48 family metalloprotease [Roseateles asaccharophilus]MDN3545113.1 M48 family metalloprotease [Roseateles asaccharophilus]TDP11500.1 putative Zn-dependent protease [Roseateles asaccharophilus]